MVLLKTFDNEQFVFEEEYLNKSNLLHNIYNNTILLEPIPILVEYKTLNIIYNFMKIDKSVLSKSYNPYDIKFKQTDIDFFMCYDCETLIELSNGCSYLEYNYCLELCCKMIAEKLKNKSAKVLRNQLGTSGECLDPTDFDWVSSDE
ncbi:hypothetical protein P3W45_001452 [Vairimorpha bombi]|jgi:S-phase kinase-associated protein 1